MGLTGTIDSENRDLYIKFFVLKQVKTSRHYLLWRDPKRHAYLRQKHRELTMLLTLYAVKSGMSPQPALTNLQRVRQDVTEGQLGVLMNLQITVIDAATCQPLPNVMVEIWSSNALGNYGKTFLRGAFTSSSSGVAEFQTIFPGYNSNGANHISVMVHSSSSMSGSIVHVGQLFFTDKWTTVITSNPFYGYNRNRHTRVLNAQDPNYKQATSNGYNAIIDIENIEDDWPTGVIGRIAIPVDVQCRIPV
ncbi:hypothetical protein AMATHDRAFT_7974 [Amanita thiersii Skay4041]|uniref:Intradiol ring-cleavage dioxygenases domain-containing protein n=1 Tax=Amanita thiersii Skay4041 TaxID=703135 RepID=A0A2A9NF87_9AGAR|nr:hypothetical protein AMATHDRAFT_7974 [Amanita thiersii Skay4041]